MRSGSIVGLLWLTGSYVLACSAPPAPVEEHSDEQPHEHATAAPGASAGLVRIESGAVCMLSNRYLGDKPDVPVDVDGKTYHGCCANCAARLAARPETREALDPVSGHKIDKASAILARDSENRVLYFESEATLAQMQHSSAAR
jgi:YHS domain-containing protein